MKKINLLIVGLFTVLQLLAAQDLVSVKNTHINEDHYTITYDLKEKVVKDNNGNYIPIAGLNVSVSILVEGNKVIPDSRYLFGIGEQHAGKNKEILWYYKEQLNKELSKEDISISVTAEVPPQVLEDIGQRGNESKESLVSMDYGLLAIAGGGAGVLYLGLDNLSEANNKRNIITTLSATNRLNSFVAEQGTTIEAFEQSEADGRSSGITQTIVGGAALGVAGGLFILRLLNKKAINETINENSYSKLNFRLSPKIETNSAIANTGISLTYNF